MRQSSFTLAWEPRGAWDDCAVGELCAALQLIHCVDPLVRSPVWGEPLYLRLHGGPGYARRYSTEELAQLKQTVAGRPAYVLFNNLRIFDDALAFSRLLANES